MTTVTPQDHRTRVAAERRERMRSRLIEGALLVFGQRGVDGSVIDELIRIAGVSRGTFYNYFRTNEELLSAVATEVSTEMSRAVAPIVRSERDPAARIANAIRLQLGLAREFPHLGAFLSRGGVRALEENSLLREFLTRDIAEGLAAGRFSVGNPRLAFDLVAGSVLAAMHTMESADAPRSYPEDIAQALLQALGLEGQVALEIARRPLPPAAISPDSVIVRSTARMATK